MTVLIRLLKLAVPVCLIPMKEDMEDLEIPLGSILFPLDLIRMTNGTIQRDQRGTIYTNPDMSNLTIELFQDETGKKTSGWNGADGFMISAPAKNRQEALEISNRLLKETLKDYVLE